VITGIGARSKCLYDSSGENIVSGRRHSALTYQVPACRFNITVREKCLCCSLQEEYSDLSVLEAIELSKSYNDTVALSALNLEIGQGEIVCLLGANGAGKTTTINLFLNFIPPSSGVARINGLNVVEHPLETKRFLAYIPEQVMLYRNLTGVEKPGVFRIALRERYSRTTFDMHR
jgi:ABC-type multidrug transport system fused ATPase/permease subunit